MRRGLGARHAPVQILAQVKFERALERGFDRGAVHLTVTLSGVPVASREQCTVVPDRQVDGAAGGKLLAVDVADELARLLAVLRAKCLGRGNSELSEKRAQRKRENRRRGAPVKPAVALRGEGTVRGK